MCVRGVLWCSEWSISSENHSLATAVVQKRIRIRVVNSHGLTQKKILQPYDKHLTLLETQKETK